MKRYFALLLAASALLTGCFGPDTPPTPDPTPTATPGNMSFTRDGLSYTQRATATVEAGSTANNNQDILHIRSADFTAASGTGTEYIDVQFSKPSGTGDTNYQLLGIYSSARNDFYAYAPLAVLSVGGNGWSGAFTGGYQPAGSNQLTSAINNGSFTEIH